MRILGQRQPHHVHAEDSADQGCRQKDRGDDGKNLKAAVGLLRGLDGDLLLKEMRTVTQRHHLVVEPVEPLPQFRCGELKRECLAHVELEALHERAQDHKLPVEP